jgi:tetratricopeptide (TPR) repeat protein
LFPATHKFIWVALIGALILAAFSNSFTAQLTFDSNFVVATDSRVHALTLDNLKTIFSTDYWHPGNGGLYRPVTTSSYLFNYAVLGNGPNPTGYHWINFLLHWLNAVLVFRIGLALFKESLAAFFTAALFAVHPVTTEAVTNIAGRADLLSAASVLGGFLLYMESKKLSGRERVRCLTTLAVVSLAGVLAKENAAVLVGLMALYDLAFRESRPVKAAYAVVLATVAVMAFARWLVFSHSGAVPDFFLDNPLLDASFWTARLTAITVLARDLWILIWPLHLSASYAYNQIPMFQWTDWHAVCVLAAVVAVAALILVMYRSSRTMFFLLGCIIIALFPTANLFILIGSIMADRFLYLPLFGFAGCLVLALKYIPKQAGLVALTLLIAAFGVRTYIRNIDWHDNLHLWMAAEKVAPKSYATHLWLAAAWGNKQPLGSEVDRAIAEARKAMAIVEPLPVEKRIQALCVPLGTYYRIKGSNSFGTAESQGWYRKSVEVLTSCMSWQMRHAELARGRRPENLPETGDFKLYENLGQSLLLLGENQKALDAFLAMQRLAPFNPDAGVHLGDAFLALGQTQQAAVAYGEALIAQPGYGDANQKLVELYSRIDKQGCAVDIDKRVNLFCPMAHENLCLAYARLDELLRAQKKTELAEQLRNAAVSGDGCPAAKP